MREQVVSAFAACRASPPGSSISASAHRPTTSPLSAFGPIDGLDRELSSKPQVRFTLDYPFQKPYAATIPAPVTLRHIVEAIRAGFRTMYASTKQRDIPGMENKDVTGPYGRAFHAIDDLVIEQIDLCESGALDISIGS